MKIRLLCLLLALCALAPSASAEPILLRFATTAPDGTAWARLFRTMGREIDADSKGAVVTKFYFSGIAGSERQMLDRLKKNQLDAVLSGGMMCMALSPSLRVLRLLGLFQSRDEASYALGRLRDTIDKEFAANGFHNVGEATLGSDMMFTREPIASLADLKRTRLWYWDLDDPMREQLKAMGVPAVGTSVEEAARAFEDHRTDGFLAIPTAVLAFQWSVGTRYVSDLHLGFLPGCMVITNHAWDQLTHEQRMLVTEVTARTQARLEELGRSQDAELLGGLFARQGVKKTPVTPSFASEFFEAARVAREALRDKMVPGALIDKVTGWLADYRAEYSRPRTN